MIDISVRDVVKAFELNKNILDGISFEINSGERVGLLGRNGAGKTTLFKLLVGELESDEGEIAIAGGKRIGLISQIPVYPPQYTTEDVLRSAHARLYELRARMEKLEAEMAAGGAPTGEYDRLLAQFEALGGYDMDFERDKVANGLEIPAEMRAQLFSSLSGGEKTRVNLARLILEKTDILLLDEPTNHLDIKATEWLEAYLLKFKGTVLTISHDRYFLDRVVDRVIEIVGGKAEFYGGNYSFYVVEKQARYDEQLKRYEREQKEAKRLEDAAARLYQWGTGNKLLMRKSFAIQRRAERIRQTERPQKEKQLHARFGEKEFQGDELMVVRGLKKSFGARVLFDGVELKAEGGERIALLGDNGTGKSTFISILMGLETADEGYVKLGPAVKKAYLPQIIHFDNPARSVLDTMIYACKCTPQTARNRLGSFKFSGEDVFKPVSALSGGEQSRLRLCILMDNDINFLILDEPTNHLDIDSREWMEGALEDYDEALLFVSHDRYFVSRFATRIWLLENGRITDYRCDYEQFRILREKQAQQTRVQDASAGREAREKKEKKKRPPNLEKRIAAEEKKIAAAEEAIRRIEQDIETYASDYEKLSDLFARKSEADAELEALYEAWGALQEEL